MPAEQTIAALAAEIDEVFGQLDRWCGRPPTELAVVPADVGWSIELILEHIGLVNHYLLLTLAKGVDLAGRRAAAGEPIPAGESDLTIFGAIADPDAFDWQPPAHMVPTGAQPAAESRALLAEQRRECCRLLARMGQGEGFLHRVRMSVRDLGRLDMYQWLWFLLMHARRHLAQVERAGAIGAWRVE
jgi:hypothetical protein